MDAVPNKANKMVPSTPGNFAALDAEGNLADSGKNPTDFTRSVIPSAAGNLAALAADGSLMDSDIAPENLQFIQTLWTNPNPNSTFAPQTVSLDLSSYDRVAITDGDMIYYCKIPGNVFMTRIGTVDGTDTGNVTIYNRKCTVAVNGITFGNGGYVTSLPNKITTNNDNQKPVKIYGIKGWF